MEQPHDRAPAPGELRLVQALVNTRDVELDKDELASPDLVRAWLGGHGLLRGDESVTEDDRRLLLEVREALRALLLANNDRRPVGDALQRLNRSGEEAHLVVRFEPEGAARLASDGSGVRGAVGQLLGIVFGAMVDGSWQRLKACRDDACQWAFYDSSKNRSGSWCTMAVCGNRAKTRSYRQRTRGVGA
jgi:predicted RNA-binding Zn ribbon-like protein